MEDNIDTIIAKYGQKPKVKPRRGQRLIVGTLIVLVAVTGGITAFMIAESTGTPVLPPTTATLETFTGPTATEVVDQIAADHTIANENNYFESRINAGAVDPNSDTSNIVYALNDYDFMTNAPAADGLQFTLRNTNSSSDKTSVTKAIQSVLEAQGFAQTTQNTSPLSAYTTTTYVNSGTVCQIVDYANVKQTTAEQSVLCIDHADLETAYRTVATMLAKAGASIASNAKTVLQTTTTEDSKILLTLNVTPKNSEKITQYYFATLKTDYEYIGSRPNPSVDDASSYTLSSELKKNISDPKWGTFLTDNIK